MAWFYLMINGAVSGAAAWFGWRTRSMRAWKFILCLLAAGAMMGLRIFLHAHPEYEQHLLMLSDDYVYFSAWEVPLVVLMTVALAGRLQHKRPRRLVVLSLGLLAPLFLWDSFSACLQPEYAMAAQFDGNGVCRQATDYSCGPAAGVTLLKLFGRTMSEGEMAELCVLKPGKGVTVLELCRGLNIALRPTGRHASVRRVEGRQLGELPVPFLAELKREGSLPHCVVVLAALEDCVILADPAYGQIVGDRAGFLREWTGVAITARPSSR
jgi:predicted double-glycine peptidase